MKKLLFIALFFPCVFFAQTNPVKVTAEYGSANADVDDLLSFENIHVEKLTFSGEAIKNKHYQISLQEFVNGKQNDRVVLFDSSEDDVLRMKSNKESLKFIFGINDSDMKVQIRGSRFGSKKSYFKLTGNADDYALKDFFGSKTEINLDITSKETPIFAIITPSYRSDGSASYCEVVQSDVPAEKLGSHFKIPHYFLVTITFK